MIRLIFCVPSSSYFSRPCGTRIEFDRLLARAARPTASVFQDDPIDVIETTHFLDKITERIERRVLLERTIAKRLDVFVTNPIGRRE